MAKMYSTVNGLLFIDMYKTTAEMGNQIVQHQRNWISYRGFVCMMKANKSVWTEVTSHTL